jgi:hypothetical protein
MKNFDYKDKDFSGADIRWCDWNLVAALQDPHEGGTSVLLRNEGDHCWIPYGHVRPFFVNGVLAWKAVTHSDNWKCKTFDTQEEAKNWLAQTAVSESSRS